MFDLIPLEEKQIGKTNITVIYSIHITSIILSHILQLSITNILAL